VRLKGHQTVCGHSETKTKASGDAAKVEQALKEGRLRTVPGGKDRTLGHAIDYYLEHVLPGVERNRSAHTTTQRLLWWKERMGHGRPAAHQ
jgi:hypothetical protein